MHLHRLKLLVVFSLLTIVLFISTIGAFAADFTVADISKKITDALISPGDTVVQKIKVTLTDGPFTFDEIWLGNNTDVNEIKDNPVTKHDLKQIVVKHNGKVLLKVDTDDLDLGDFINGQSYELDQTTQIEDGDKVIINYEVADEITYDKTYEKGADTDKVRKLQPKVIINPPAVDSKNVALYRKGKSNKILKLYPPLEKVKSLSPPDGGPYHGVRLLAQRIRLGDSDPNNNAASIDRIRLFNRADKPRVPEDMVKKIEILDDNGDLLGERTDLTGLNVDNTGATIYTVQNNTISDNSQTTLYIYVTFVEEYVNSLVPPATSQEPKDKLSLTTMIFSKEAGGEGKNVVPFSGSKGPWEITRNFKPEGRFSYDPSTGLTYETEITFTVIQVIDDNGDEIVSYRWEFSDGDTASGKSVKHTFENGGDVWAKLIVEDEYGATGETTRSFHVDPPPGPTAAFSVAPKAPEVGQEITFTDKSSTIGDAEIVKWEWNFGDGETITINFGENGNVKHTYSAKNLYTVQLKVTDDRGDTDTVTKELSVYPATPTADFTPSTTTVRIHKKVTFKDKSSSPGNTSIETWIWDFGDGDIEVIYSKDSSNGDTSHTYTKEGTYIVTLTVINSDDKTDKASKSITVTVAKPEANFSYSPSLPQEKEEIQFTDQSQKGDANITSWEWDFGDGEGTSTEQNPTYSYSEPGAYQVTLTVTDGYSKQDTVTKTVVVVQKGEDIYTYPYPNPTSSPVNIVYYLPDNTTQAHLWIIDMSGDLALHKTDLATNSGENEVTVDLADLPNGLYFYWIRGKADGKRIRSKPRKILVQHGG